MTIMARTMPTARTDTTITGMVIIMPRRGTSTPGS